MAFPKLPGRLNTRKQTSMIEDLLLIAAITQIPIKYASEGYSPGGFSAFSAIFIVSGLSLILIQFRYIRPLIALLGIIGFFIWLPPIVKFAYPILLAVLLFFLFICRRVFGWGS